MRERGERREGEREERERYGERIMYTPISNDNEYM